MLQAPNIGDVVTVTTRYPNSYYKATDPWVDTTYENVPVIAGPRWVKPNQFCIPCTGEPYITFRVIHMSQVHELEILGRDTESVDTTLKVVEVKGSRGNTYQVTINDGVATSCTCPGYQFRRQCRHLKEAVEATKPVTVDSTSTKGDRSHQSMARKEKVMADFKELSWGERFAVIDALKPTDDQIMSVLGIDNSELATARELREAGTFKADLGDLNAEDFASAFAGAPAPTAEPTPAKPEKTTATRATRARKNDAPATATKPERTPKKRGRKGTKIQDAFAAITTTPVPLEQFAEKFAVSQNVLRQAKRFDRTGSDARVRIKQVDGTLSIFREAAKDE